MRRVLLLVLLVAAPAASAGSVVEVGWRETVVERVFEASLVEGGTREFDLDVRFPNLTRVDAALRWDDDDAPGVSRNDRFRLAIRGPDDLGAAPQEGSGGLLHAAVRVNAAPPETRLEEGESLDDFVGSKGVGAWRVTVELVDVGDPEGARVDPGESIVLTVTLRSYEAVPLSVVTLEDGAPVAASVGGPWGLAAGGLALLGGGLGVALWRRR